MNGKFYLRKGPNSQQLNREEIRGLFREEGFIRFDETPNKKFEFDNDFDRHKFKTFLDRAHISEVLDQKKILENLLLIENGKMKNAGVLLFCHRITKFFFGATIKCVLFRGKDKYKILTMKEFDADLYSNYQNAITFLQSHLRTEYIIKGGPREEILELPEDALREAVLNAIAHRDYYSTAGIQVEIYEDRTEIVNPGGLIGNLTVEDLYSRSIPRNPLLFGLMERMELVEKVGSGLLRINEAMEKYKLPTPLIEADKNFFKITFVRPDLQKMTIEERVKKGVEKGIEKGVEKLPEKQKIILSLIRKNPGISKKQIAVKGKLSKKSVEYNIRKLKERGILKRMGPAKGGRWEIVEEKSRQ